MTNIYHIRPVEAARDRRSEQQRAEERGVAYASLCLVYVDYPHITPLYPEAATRKHLDFRPELACLDILESYLVT